MLVKAVGNITAEETVQYLLTMIDELLQNDPSRVALFQSVTLGDSSSCTVFLRYELVDF